MLTRFALDNRTFVLALLLLCIVAGPISFLSHPSREDPAITIRNAQVIAQYPGMSASRVEDLITRRLEEKIREMPEVKHIESTSSTGQSLLKIEVQDQYVDMDPIWADLRNKMDDVRSSLPSGTIGPQVLDDQGNVAMATIAITAEGFENWEMREAAKELRRIVYATVPGVRKVDLYGVEEQKVYVEFDNIRISQLGIDPNEIVSSITQQNVILPGGRVEADGLTMTIEPSGDFTDLEDLAGLQIQIPGDPPTSIYVRDIADVRLGYSEPPEAPAFYNGKPTVVVGVSMIDQVDSNLFSATLKEVVRRFEQAMPWGVELSFITFQQNEINASVYSVMNNLWQTCLVVLAVVIAFLGLRTGLIVGAMVPMVMLISTLVMRWLEIELERMSLASLIISLGLLVDNGIVVAEDIQGRIKRGQERIAAALEAGRTLTMPLLAASLTTILAFMPLMLAPGAPGEYTRSISLVIGIALAISWVVALTVLLIICVWFMKAGEAQDEDAVYDRSYYNAYRGFPARGDPLPLAGHPARGRLAGVRRLAVPVHRQDLLPGVGTHAVAGHCRVAGRRQHARHAGRRGPYHRLAERRGDKPRGRQHGRLCRLGRAAILPRSPAARRLPERRLHDRQRQAVPGRVRAARPAAQMGPDGGAGGARDAQGNVDGARGIRAGGIPHHRRRRADPRWRRRATDGRPARRARHRGGQERLGEPHRVVAGHRQPERRPPRRGHLGRHRERAERTVGRQRSHRVPGRGCQHPVVLRARGDQRTTSTGYAR